MGVMKEKLIMMEVRWLEDRRERIQSPPQQDSLPSTQTDPSTPGQQDLLTPVQQDPSHRHRFQQHGHRLYLSSRAATHISAILQERFSSPYYHWFEVPLDIRNMWWGEFQKSYVWYPSLSMTKIRDTWEVKVSDWMRICLAMLEGQGRGLFGFLNVLGADDKQADLTKRFSKSRHLEKLHKYQSGDKKGQYVDFHSEEFLDKEEVAATSVPLPGEIQLMATIFGRLDCSRLYRAGSEISHLRAKSSRAVARLPPCYLEVEQRIMRQVEASVSSVCAAFDEHIRRFAEQSYLSYTPMLPMMDIVRAAMAVVSQHHHRHSSCGDFKCGKGIFLYSPPPSIDAPSTSTVDPFPSPRSSNNVRDPEDY
ncbi:hypothetical protein M9H77_26286 [Catharanthus roseus]|uniref:Uncharacterized protein n=1 Tax=Catharanthus roseus TaxID=4058 RepID=A0ACC0A996_CATRO|nr:hypothetical protein M9H77_26286 [Catharanthus roseus]